MHKKSVGGVLAGFINDQKYLYIQQTLQLSRGRIGQIINNGMYIASIQRLYNMQMRNSGRHSTGVQLHPEFYKNKVNRM